ncbi:MAG: 4Fe-4S ferredoxin, partial [Cellulomonas sp.]
AAPAAPEETAPTRVSTRPAAEVGAGGTAPDPGTADATIVLDPVPAAGEDAPQPPAPPRRRSRRDAAAPTEPLGTVPPEADRD